MHALKTLWQSWKPNYALLLLMLFCILIGMTIGTAIFPIPLDDGRGLIPWYQLPLGIMRYDDLERNATCWVFLWGQRVSSYCIDGRYLDS